MRDRSPPTTDAPDTVVVLTTCATDEDAATLVRALLDRRLVACGTLLPGARSLYRWEGRVADERETAVLLKTTRARVADLGRAFAELHPYAVPELLALPVTAALARYADWVADETGPVGAGAQAPAPTASRSSGAGAAGGEADGSADGASA
jgi:periplasmic divalent cation tolerance protein